MKRIFENAYPAMEAKTTLPATVAKATMRLLPIQRTEYLLNAKNALYESSVHTRGKMLRDVPAVATAGPNDDMII